MSAEEIAWAAGLFEGEGCITFSLGARDGTWRMSLRMNDKDVVQRFVQAIGVGHVRPESSGNRPKHWSQQWGWTISTRADIVHSLDLMLPWFGERRSARATEALEWFEENLGPRGCIMCAETFLPKRKRSRFCGSVCHNRYYDRRYKARARVAAGQLEL